VLASATRADAPLLDIRGLKTHFSTDDGVVQAVDGVDISIGRGKTVCVVGESGCGKTVTAHSVLKLIAMPPGRIVAGHLGDGHLVQLGHRDGAHLVEGPLEPLVEVVERPLGLL